MGLLQQDFRTFYVTHIFADANSDKALKELLQYSTSMITWWIKNFHNVINVSNDNNKNCAYKMAKTSMQTNHNKTQLKIKKMTEREEVQKK